MLRWLVVLLVLSFITFLLGFTTLFGNTLGLARMLFPIYAGLAILTLVIGIVRR
jgi:uncharacterized membrane protein YtjA (UPF0391 family)